jgi:MFS family permease
MDNAQSGESAATFVSNNLKWLAAGFAMFGLSSFGQTYFLSLSFGEVRQLYSVSYGELGIWMTIVTLLSGFAILLTGHWIDRFPTRKIIAISLPVLSVSIFLYQIQLPFVLFIVNLFVLRLVAQGYMVHFAYTVIGRWFSLRRGFATSLTVAGQNFGQMILPIAYVSASVALGWNTTWTILALLVLITTPVLMRLASTERESSGTIPGDERPNESNNRHYRLKDALRSPEFYFFILAIIPMALIANALFFSQVHLVDVRNWNLETFSLGFPVAAIATTIFSLISGMLVDRYSAAILLPFHLIPLSLGCVMLATIPGEWVVFPFMALMGISNGFSLTLFGAIWPETFGTKHLGTIRSLVTMVVICAAAAGPGISGLLLEQQVSIDTIIQGLGCFGFAASIVSVPWAWMAHVEWRKCISKIKQTNTDLVRSPNLVEQAHD